MSEDTPPPPTAASGEPTPRLRIQHLLTWTAMSAILLVACQTRQLQAIYPSAWFASALLYPIAAAAAFVALGACVSWRRQGRRWLQDPGHGIALIVVVQFLLGMPLLLIYAAHATDGDAAISWSALSEFEQVWLQYGGTLSSVLAGVLSFVFAIGLADTGFWRAFFLMRPVAAFGGHIANVFVIRLIPPSEVQSWIQSGWYYAVGQAFDLIWLAILVAACYADYKRNHHRDWMHWWGVFAVGIPAVVSAGAIGVIILQGGVAD